MSTRKTINDLSREIASMEEANNRRNDGILAVLKSFFGFSQKSADATHSLIKAHDSDMKKGFDAQLSVVKAHDKKSDERAERIIGEVRKNSVNRKKSFGLLLLVIIIGAVLALASYWFVIDSGLCHLGGLWREVVQRDSWGNIIPNSFTYELVEGAKIIWGALSAALGISVAALLHAIIPWYNREEV